MILRKTVKELTKEGRKKYPPYVFANTLEEKDGVFWHNKPRKYELVYRGCQYIYVPVGDKKSSERNGGFWQFVFQGMDLSFYGGNLSFHFVNYNKCLLLQNMISKILDEDPKLKYGYLNQIKFCNKLFEYCRHNNINILDFLPDIQEMHDVSVSSWNARMKPYYIINPETKKIEGYDVAKENEKRINKWLIEIKKHEDQILKIRNKIKLLENT